MNNNINTTYRLFEGYGDTIIAAIALQEYSKDKSKKASFITNSIVSNLLKYSPFFDIKENTKDESIYDFKWASQIYKEKGISLYNLHTINRFAVQFGHFANPASVLEIYDSNGNIIVNKCESNIVCINTQSKEPKKRYIPNEYIDQIIDLNKKSNYNTVFVGDCGNTKSITDVQEIVNLFKIAKLFIGPVSFPYHLAASFNIPCMAFFSFAPYWNYCHFKHTIPIQSSNYGNCFPFCEEDEVKNNFRLIHENGCGSGYCKSNVYNKDEIKFNLERLLK